MNAKDIQDQIAVLQCRLTALREADAGGKPIITREAFVKLDPTSAAAVAKSHQIVD